MCAVVIIYIFLITFIKKILNLMGKKKENKHLLKVYKLI